MNGWMNRLPFFDPLFIISAATDTTNMVGEYLMFFQNNTRSIFTTAQN